MVSTATPPVSGMGAWATPSMVNVTAPVGTTGPLAAATVAVSMIGALTGAGLARGHDRCRCGDRLARLIALDDDHTVGEVRRDEDAVGRFVEREVPRLTGREHDLGDDGVRGGVDDHDPIRVLQGDVRPVGRVVDGDPVR